MDLGELKIAEFHERTLQLYLAVASITAVLLIPIYVLVGIPLLTGLVMVYAIVMILTTLALRRQWLPLPVTTRIFLAATFLVCMAGLSLGDELVDNKPWQILIPIAAFTAAGSREGGMWAGASLFCAAAIMLLRWPAYDISSMVLLLTAHATASTALYLYARSYEKNIRLIAKLSHTDTLTGAYNRQLFDELSSNVVNRSRRNGDSVAVYMIDIDHFKDYNDRYGHIAGDRALAAVGELLRSSARRATDLVFRFGGEEFCIVSTGSSVDEACQLAERLIRGVSGLAIPHADAEHNVLTISVGLSHHEMVESESTEGIIERADKALYAAKVQGRNRLVQFLHEHLEQTDLASQPS